ncbi:MAG: sigma-54 dependent transcriptional regulator [gamma proteobacterium symbiont of Taylorina sp.]|nr:sigma-54 dependent transcriptional regulator [gamma proteobacterium symbiont of Taylorina sp.]
MINRQLKTESLKKNNPQAPLILVVEDDEALREALVDTLDMGGYNILEADNGRTALEQLAADTFSEIDIVISDVQMPKMDGHQLLKQIKRHYDLPVLLMTAYGTISKAIEAMKDGAVDYLVKPFEAEVLVSVVSRYVGKSIEDHQMIAESASMQKINQLAKRVADSNATVMIGGGSGTGKEVLARFIHNHSSRADKPFIAINCAAIPENMLEATLFGYEKGAFTGAYKASAGKFEQAQGGTLLLDEISEMDLGLQAKLLRVLQEKEVERLGGQELISLDVRVLATSNRNMHQQVREYKFREDLFYRLNVFPIALPDLKDRKEDIMPLANHIINKIAKQNGVAIPTITKEAEQKLVEHSWPGNIREVDNVIQRAFILHMDGVITAEDIPMEVIAEQIQNTAASMQYSNEEIITIPSSAQALEKRTNTGSVNLNDELRGREFDKILEILQSTMGNRKMAAEQLGISQRTLRYKLAKMRDGGITIPGGFGVKTA